MMSNLLKRILLTQDINNLFNPVPKLKNKSSGYTNAILLLSKLFCLFGKCSELALYNLVVPTGPRIRNHSAHQ